MLKISQIYKYRLVTAVFLFITINSAMAQINIPQLSPNASVAQIVGISNVSIDYSRPYVNGRKIFGDLVPYNVVWRTGANKCTSIKFDDDMHLNGTLIKAGNYGLYTVPNKEEWTIILNKDDSQFGSFKYDTKKDVLRFNVKPATLKNTAEQLEFKFEQINPTASFICLEFEKESVKFKVEQFPDEKIMKEIKEKTTAPNPSFVTLARAANYYLDHNRNLEQALLWTKKASEMDSTSYFILNLMANIYLKMGNYSEAEITANKSQILATAAKDIAFVKLNNQVIEQGNKLKSK